MLRVVTLDVERSSVTAQYHAFLCLQLMGSWEHNKKLTEFPFILAEVIFLHLSLHVRFAACFRIILQPISTLDTYCKITVSRDFLPPVFHEHLHAPDFLISTFWIFSHKFAKTSATHRCHLVISLGIFK
jgi:hypothetical protein